MIMGQEALLSLLKIKELERIDSMSVPMSKGESQDVGRATWDLGKRCLGHLGEYHVCPHVLGRFIGYLPISMRKPGNTDNLRQEIF
jgi:hypothetical protein